MEKKETHKFASAIVAGEQLMLHPFRGLYWKKEKMLLLADLHLGKAVHFRRAGIPVPSAVSHSNWDRLIALLLDFEPERVVFLGDLFHSDYNSEWEELADLIHQFDHIDFELVIGNHDILDMQNYERAGLISHGTGFNHAAFSIHPRAHAGRRPRPVQSRRAHTPLCVFARERSSTTAVALFLF
jgi:predicted MPP superfamily phosphohydrolase